jgi:hypothetical protein
VHEILLTRDVCLEEDADPYDGFRTMYAGVVVEFENFERSKSGNRRPALPDMGGLGLVNGLDERS